MLGRFFRGFREFGVKSATRQHSPMSQYLGPEAQHLRSELFTSKRFIPGRRFKFYVLTSFIGSVFGWAMVAKVHSIYKLRDLENRRAIRKAVPFFQAIEDLRFIALEDKLQLIAESVFANKTQEWISAAQERFHYGETNRWYIMQITLY